MKTIERYVFGSFLTSFLLAFLVLSFVLTIGLLVQIVGYIMDGVPLQLVGRFCLVSLPETLQWSLPLALLVSAILVFSRLSADSEIAAMRACGIHLFTVMKWPVIFALGCTLLGFWVNNEVVPRGHEVRRTLKTRVSVGAGLSVLEPGRVIDDFPNVKIYFKSREGNWLNDLVVLDYSNPKIDRVITANRALVEQDGSNINLDLRQMTIDPIDENHPTMARANRFVYTMKDVLKNKPYQRRLKDYRLREILFAIEQQAQSVAKTAGSNREKASPRFVAETELSRLRVELNKRLVFAMASICFVLAGIPLGIRSQRKESSVGMAIALATSLGYYVIVILMLSLETHFIVRPDILIWLPVALSLGLAAYFTHRHL